MVTLYIFRALLPDTEVSFVPDHSSITVTWKVAANADKTSSKEVVRKISLRRFSQDNVTQLYVLEDFNSTSEVGGQGGNSIEKNLA